MYRRIFIPVVLALVAALAFSGVGYAANDRLKPIYHINGTIINVDPAALTIDIHTTQGDHRVHLEANTVYRGNVSSMAGLTQWMVVKVTAKLVDGRYQAKIVKVTGYKEIFSVSGQVTAIQGKNFTILATDGNAFTIVVKAKTRFSGYSVKKINQLRPGMQVDVSYVVMTGGKLRAETVLVVDRK